MDPATGEPLLHVPLSPPRALPLEAPRELQHGTLRRGEYKAFTFRLPAHLPELILSITLKSATGCVCLYASNCSQRPRPNMCQWSLIVSAEGERHRSLVVRTEERHFIQGFYHVGIYGVSDSSFSLGCFSSPPTSVPKTGAGAVVTSRGPGASNPGLRGARGGKRVGGGKPEAWSTTGRGAYGDPGRLEDALAARLARHPCRHAAGMQVGFLEQPDGEYVPPGDRHHQRVCGDWHLRFQDVLTKGSKVPPKSFAAASPREWIARAHGHLAESGCPMSSAAARPTRRQRVLPAIRPVSR